jgi:hypothetical protein
MILATRRGTLSRVSETGRRSSPFGPVKCAGAPQKMLHMAWDRWTKTGRGESVKSEFVTGLVSVFVKVIEVLERA